VIRPNLQQRRSPGTKEDDKILRLDQLKTVVTTVRCGMESFGQLVERSSVISDRPLRERQESARFLDGEKPRYG
jgi:hypothetical protein